MMDLCSHFLQSYLLVPKLIFVHSFVSKARFVVPVLLPAILHIVGFMYHKKLLLVTRTVLISEAHCVYRLQYQKTNGVYLARNPCRTLILQCCRSFWGLQALLHSLSVNCNGICIIIWHSGHPVISMSFLQCHPPKRRE